MASVIAAGLTTGTAIAISGDTSGALVLQTNGTTTAVTIDTAQGVKVLNCIGVGSATPSTSGAGISFPATQSASTDANTLDDYEEGTWTPTQGASLTVVGAFSSSGLYTKIGRLVTVQARLLGATSIATVSGSMIPNLPFTVGVRSAQGAMTNGTPNQSSSVYADTATTVVYSAGTITASSAIEFTITYAV